MLNKLGTLLKVKPEDVKQVLSCRCAERAAVRVLHAAAPRSRDVASDGDAPLAGRPLRAAAALTGVPEVINAAETVCHGHAPVH